MLLSIVLSTVVVPRSLRVRLGLMPVARWLVPAWRCFALPLAVSRNRFLVALCVFCLGIVPTPCSVPQCNSVHETILVETAQYRCARTMREGVNCQGLGAREGASFLSASFVFPNGGVAPR